MAVGLLALVMLVVVPVLLRQYTRPIWREITDSLEPARDLVNDVQASLALEMSALRGFLLTGEDRFLDLYRKEQLEEERLLGQLQRRTRRIGPAAWRSYQELRARSARWRAESRVNQFPDGGPAPTASAEQIQIQQADFEATLAAAYRLEDAINREIDQREADIERLERLDVRITGGLVLVALLAALGVGWLGRRLRTLTIASQRLAHAAEQRREEVEQLMESKARLIRGFSHDVKNPLGAAVGYARLAEEGLLEGFTPQQKPTMTRIRTSIDSALATIDDLVELSRAEAGELHVERAPTDVGRLAKETAEEYRAAAVAAGQTVDIRPPGALPVITTDGARIQQILGNLISNAVKYTPRGGRITIRTELRSGGRAPGPGSWLTVDVADTGLGIPREKQEAIFQEFTRLEPGTQRGVGLGLAISRRIARILGGDVTVESEVGQGATFTLWLPVIRSESVEPAAPGSA